MLGRGFLLSAANSNFAGKGGNAMYLHQDQGYVPMPYPPFPLVCQTIWLLDDFKQESGGTILVPKSHNMLTIGKNFQDKDQMIGNKQILSDAHHKSGVLSYVILHIYGKKKLSGLSTSSYVYLS